ncbi:Rad55 protein [Ceratocystis lukuohia]|uniref:Rad55 protein n=1 Tax=Ceratocystis lukuohia TaxID=2019550 RepID=A0ABR4MQ25_9PEZI
MKQHVDRLPAVSAAEALDDPDDDSLRPISTGLDDLDAVLSPAPDLELQNASPDSNSEAGDLSRGGIPLGQLTEVWGPPGVGKTTFGIQAAATALVKKRAVMWVDCNTPLWGPRFAEVLNGVYQSQLRAAKQPMARQSSEAHEEQSQPEAAEFDIGSTDFTYNHCQGPADKRLQAVQFLVSSLQKLAATRQCAVLLLSQCASKMESGRAASLVPAINGTVWEQAIATRLVLFKDWIWRGRDSEVTPIRHDSFQEVVFVGVQKLQGKTCVYAMEHMVGFRIESAGLVSVKDIRRNIGGPFAERHGPKRNVSEAGLEIPDSDDEEDEYGWDDRYNNQVPRPSQWQGSEDLILDANRHDEDDGEGDDNDEISEPTPHDGDHLDAIATGNRSGDGDRTSGTMTRRDGVPECGEHYGDGEEYGEHGNMLGFQDARRGQPDGDRRRWGSAEHDRNEANGGVQSGAQSQDLTSSQRLVLGLDFGTATQGRRLGEAVVTTGSSRARARAKPKTKGRESKAKADYSVTRRPKRTL